ncbi:hypothetical protein [Streptomyces sp. NPDC059783]|uniref:hypothetical protein n=1 Tax=Streptomyces sp. NPDC059783 TaxID=3346944 RepID=UPI00365FABE1
MTASTARTTPAFPGHDSGLRLVDVTTGAEITPGQTIPEPYGHGHITYPGPTVHTREGDPTPQPGRVAVLRYTSPATDRAFRYEDADASTPLTTRRTPPAPRPWTPHPQPRGRPRAHTPAAP